MKTSIRWVNLASYVTLYRRKYVYSIQYSTSNLSEFLNNMKIITKCFGLNEIKSDICLIEFLIVFQESVIFFSPTSVRSMYSKYHLR